MSKKLFTDGRTTQNYSSEPHNKWNIEIKKNVEVKMDPLKLYSYLHTSRLYTYIWIVWSNSTRTLKER